MRGPKAEPLTGPVYAWAVWFVSGEATVYDIAQGSARNLSLRLTGTLRADTSIVRTIDDDVRVRAEDVSFITDSATDCPALQACTLP